MASWAGFLNSCLLFKQSTATEVFLQLYPVPPCISIQVNQPSQRTANWSCSVCACHTLKCHWKLHIFKLKSSKVIVLAFFFFNPGVLAVKICTTIDPTEKTPMCANTYVFFKNTVFCETSVIYFHGHGCTSRFLSGCCTRKARSN